MATNAKWAHRVKARWQGGWAEVGMSKHSLGEHHLITVRASPGGSHLGSSARLTLDEAKALRRALSRAIRETSK